MLEWTGSWSLGRRLSMRLTFTSGAGPGPDNLSHQPQICHWRGRGSRDSPGGTAGTSSSRGSGLSALTSKAPSAPPLSSPKRELPAAPSAAPPASAGIEGDRTAQKSRLLQIKKKKFQAPEFWEAQWRQGPEKGCCPPPSKPLPLRPTPHSEAGESQHRTVVEGPACTPGGRSPSSSFFGGLKDPGEEEFGQCQA